MKSISCSWCVRIASGIGICKWIFGTAFAFFFIYGIKLVISNMGVPSGC